MNVDSTLPLQRRTATVPQHQQCCMYTKPGFTPHLPLCALRSNDVCHDHLGEWGEKMWTTIGVRPSTALLAATYVVHSELCSEWVAVHSSVRIGTLRVS